VIVEVLTSSTELEQLAPEWRAVEATATLQLPFFTSDWAIAWWRHLRENRLLTRDRLFTCAVRDDDRALIGVAPFMITERPRLGPLRLRCLQLMGADPNITELGTVLARPGREADVYTALAERLWASRDEWDWLRWGGVPADAPDTGPLDRIGAVWREETSDWVLELAPTWEEFKSKLSRNIKESLRKCANAPKRDGVSYTFEVATRPDDVAASIERFFELHEARAHVEGTIHHSDAFDAARSRSFLREVGERFSRRGVVHCFNLKVGGDTIATRIGFRLGDSMYLYYSGYAAQYARYSAMTTCVAEAIRWSIAAGLKQVNLSPGTDVSKTRWGPTEVRFRQALVVAPAMRSRAARALDGWARSRAQTKLARRLLAVVRRRR
jgi:CelD/BcsL family acetyltransferase involved in cellulose biosynthesis